MYIYICVCVFCHRDSAQAIREQFPQGATREILFGGATSKKSNSRWMLLLPPC